jgi:hypothetical protein
MAKKYDGPIVCLADKDDPRVPGILKQMARDARRRPSHSKRQYVNVEEVIGKCPHQEYDPMMVLYDTFRWAIHDSHTSEGRDFLAVGYIHALNQMRAKDNLPNLTDQQQIGALSTLRVGFR